MGYVEESTLKVLRMPIYNEFGYITIDDARIDETCNTYFKWKDLNTYIFNNSCRGINVYSCGNVPSFRRNGYRCSGRSIPSDRNRIPPASFWLVRVYSLNAGSSPYTSLMDL